MIININVGTAPNDGTGDPLRFAFQKVNTNYTWLTNKIGADDQGLQLSGNIGSRLINLAGATNIYEDLNFSIQSLNPAGIGSAATTVVNSGPSGVNVALQFTTNNTLYAAITMPRSWVPGTAVYPGIHIQPQLNGANTIVWTGSYSMADVDGTYPLSTTIPNFNTNIPAGSQWKHLLYPMPPGGIDTTGMNGPSTILRLKFQVVSSTNTFHLIGFGCRYRWGGSPAIYP